MKSKTMLTMLAMIGFALSNVGSNIGWSGEDDILDPGNPDHRKIMRAMKNSVRRMDFKPDFIKKYSRVNNAEIDKIKRESAVDISQCRVNSSGEAKLDCYKLKFEQSGVMYKAYFQVAKGDNRLVPITVVADADNVLKGIVEIDLSNTKAATKDSEVISPK